MRYMIAIMLMLSGCSTTAEREYNIRRVSLEREVELLQLQRRKLYLQLSIAKLDRKMETDLTSDE